MFNKVERTIGRPLEDLSASRRFVDVMVTGLKARRTVTGTAGWVVGGAVNKVLRTANVATRDDLKRLTGQLSVLAAEVRANSTSQVQSGIRKSTAAAPRKSTAPRAAQSRPGPTRPPTGTSAPSDGTARGGELDG